MLDTRIYRAALIPALVAIVFAAFSFKPQARPADTTFSPDAFNDKRAFATLQELATQYPSRRPGSAGDFALAERLGEEFTQAGFVVAKRHFKAATVDGKKSLETVVAVKAGVSTRRIVVMAHRDALTAPAMAQLSGTAALVELARVFKLRKIDRTLVLVSTSGGSGGFAGAEEFAAHTSGRVGAALVVGDLAGSRLERPQVVSWGGGRGFAPSRLRRTVELALRTETGRDTANTLHLSSQLFRLALPLTLGEQGPLLAHGVPAVLLQASGERGPGSNSAVLPRRFASFGRALLRSVTALDGDHRLSTEPTSEISFARKLVPTWAVRLVVLALLLPALLASIDSFVRAHSRREQPTGWLLWVLSAALASLPALLLGKLMALVGLLPALDSVPLPAGAFTPGAETWVAFSGIVVGLLLSWFWLRPMLLRFFGPSGETACVGAATALSLTVSSAVLITWFFSPLTAALFLPAVHLWSVATSPALRLPRLVALLAVPLGLVLPILAVIYYCARFVFSPVDLFWNVLLFLVAHRPSWGTLLLLSVVTGCFICSLRLALAPTTVVNNRRARR